MFERIIEMVKQKPLKGNTYKIALGHNRIGIIDFNDHKLTRKDIEVIKEDIMETLKRRNIEAGDILRNTYIKSPLHFHRVYYKIRCKKSKDTIYEFKVVSIKETRW